MNHKTLLRVWRSRVRSVEKFTSQFPEPDEARDGLETLADEGIIEFLPRGYFVVTEEENEEYADRIQQVLHQPTDDTVEVTVGGAMYEEETTFETEKDPSEIVR